MLLSCVSLTAYADETVIGGTFTDSNGVEFTWSLDTATGAFAVDGTGEMYLEANPHLEGQLPWVDYNGTDYRSRIKSISIGSGITRLGRQLFQEFTSLETAVIPGTVTGCGWGLFTNCTALKSVTFEEGFKATNDKTFQRCTSLTEINLPSTLANIGQNFVMGCTALTKLTLPSKVILTQNAFGDNKGGENGAAVIPAPEANIGHSIDFTVYAGSSAETYLDTYYPGTIVSRIENLVANGDIGVDTNGDESGLAWTVYDSGKLEVTRKTDANGAYIGTGMMPNFAEDGSDIPWKEYKTTVTKAVFDSGVARIGDRALQQFTALKTVEMSNTVTTLGTYVFNSCTALTSITLSDNIASLPSGIFNRTTSLKALTIPYSAKVAASTFAKVQKDLVLTVYSGSPAYEWATGEGSSEGLTPVLTDLMSGNTTGESGGLAYTVKDAGGKVTDDGSVTWSFKDGVLTISGTGEIPNYTATTELPWAGIRKQITSAVVAAGITRIGDRAFQECTNMTSAVMADTVTATGTYIFNACSRLASVKLSANLDKIQDGTFNNASGLKELTVPSKTAVAANSFTKTASDIKINVYAGSAAHTAFGDALTIENILEIGSTNDNKVYGTRSCTLLTTESGTDGDTTWSWDYATKTVTIGGTGAMTSWHTDSDKKTDAYWYQNRGWNGYQGNIEKVVIGSGITYIGDYAFMQCGKLAEVEFEENSSLRTVGQYAFSNTILTEVVIPDGTTTIMSHAFRASSVDNTDTHTLTKIVFPDSLVTIYESALSRQSKAVVYCNYGSKAAEFAQKSGVEYRLMDTDYYIENYTKADTTAKILNSTDSEKDATVVFTNYADGVLTSVSMVPVTLASGVNNVAAGSDFVQSEVGNVYVFLWDKIGNVKPIAKAYLPAVKVWMLGDSIMADWSDGRYPQEGWGEAFKDVVTDNVTVNNRAISGYTAEGFYEKVWANNTADTTKAPIKDELSQGDYVIVAFLHNDYCMAADPTKAYYKSTDYINTYKSYMKKFVEDCEAAGANIILAVPPNKGVTYNFHAALVDGVDIGDYSAVIPALAEDMDVPCVDIHKWTMEETAKDVSFLDTIYLTKNYINGLIAIGELTQEQISNHTNSGLKNNGQDTTHLSILGCKNIAEFVADSIKSQNIGLKAFLK